MSWWKIGLVAIAVYAGVMTVLARSCHQDARDADARADSVGAIADSSRAVADSLTAVADSVSEREQAVRDSLNEQLAEAERTASNEHAATVGSGEHLQASLDSLSRSVRPELEPVVATARSQADSVLTAHDRFREAMERQVRLLAQDTASLARELEATRTALDTTRAALTDAEDALSEMTEARNKWRDAARLKLFGLPPAVTHALAAGAGFAAGTL